MNEQEILKYLDNELTEKDKKTFEKKIAGNPEIQRRLDEVRLKRRAAHEVIDLLNPRETVVLPDFRKMKSAGKKRTLLHAYRWRAAAAILILTISALGYYLLKDESGEDPIAANHNDAQFVEEETMYNELDYYISPNRCWHRRQLILTKDTNNQ